MQHKGQQILQRTRRLATVLRASLFLTVLTHHLLGDGPRDALDPRARRR